MALRACRGVLDGGVVIAGHCGDCFLASSRNCRRGRGRGHGRVATRKMEAEASSSQLCTALP